MRNFLTGLLGLAAVLAASATPATAQPDVSEWDMDGDGALSAEEFDQGLQETGAFGEWDADGDGTISEEEFNEHVFNAYDEDGNDELDEAEFGEPDEEDFWGSVILCPEEQVKPERR